MTLTIKKVIKANNNPAITDVKKSVWNTYNAIIAGITIAKKPRFMPNLKETTSSSGAIILWQLSQIIECSWFFIKYTKQARNDNLCLQCGQILL